MRCSSRSPASSSRAVTPSAELLALRPRLDVTPVQVLRADDIALVVNDWTMTGTGPDGSPVRQGGRSADVVRRQTDGTWLVLVDKP